MLAKLSEKRYQKDYWPAFVSQRGREEEYELGPSRCSCQLVCIWSFVYAFLFIRTVNYFRLVHRCMVSMHERIHFVPACTKHCTEEKILYVRSLTPHLREWSFLNNRSGWWIRGRQEMSDPLKGVTERIPSPFEEGTRKSSPLCSEKPSALL